MVERFLRILHREWSGLHEAAFLLAGFALFSQVLALVRDRMLASQFGAGEQLDIYYAAFRIPDFLYASVASFVAVTVLIPFLLERMSDDGKHEQAHEFLNSVFTVFLITMLLICMLICYFMPYLSQFVVPGFIGETRTLYIELSRILLLSPILLGISNLFGSITQTFKRFMVFALGAAAGPCSGIGPNR
jgi:putative peptidoglycan lipid II flippase